MQRVSLDKNVLGVTLPLTRNSKWCYWILLLSDVHYDSIKCKRELLKSHLDLALEREAGIVSTGDFFDLMQGKLDPRQAKDEIRPEYCNVHYLDSVLDDAMVFLEPYAQNIIMMSDGNHETAIKKRYETCPTSRLLHDLNRHNKKNKIAHGAYAGWLRYKFKESGSGNRPAFLKHHHYHHGTGQKAKTAHHRRAMVCPDADILSYGHYHTWWSDIVARYRINRSGTIVHDTQLHLGIPGYKDDVKQGADGWAVEKGNFTFMPKACGAWWLKFEYSRSDHCVTVSPEMAK
jgi:UDP-2,3-diacylglucosamine pyrophosphatase LpxH